MKNSIKKILIFLLLTPLILLTACSDPQYYTITASPSDSLLGVVQGTINEKMVEGTKVTLIAKENVNTVNTNPFLCWIKDQNKIVSTERQLNLTYNKSTSGNYIALFAETDPQKMMYASIKDITFNSDLEIQTINLKMQYALTTSSSDFVTIFETSFENGMTYQTDNKDILYFGTSSLINEFLIRLEITLVYQDSSTTSPYTLEFKEKVNRNSFDKEGNLIISQYDIISQSNLNITFSKINASLLNNSIN